MPKIKEEGVRFKVVVPHIPYLPSDQDLPVSYQRVNDDKPVFQYIKLKSFPLDDASYSYEEAIDVLEIFTSRWQLGRCDPLTEPYAKAISDSSVTFTLMEFKSTEDAEDLLLKFCKNRKRKEGLGGRMFSSKQDEDDQSDTDDDVLDLT
jgi:hypothetical protein